MNIHSNGWGVHPLGEVAEFLDNLRVPVKDSERAQRQGPYPYYGANGQVGWIDDFIFDEPLVLLAEDGGNFGSKEKSIAYRINGKTWVNNHAHVLRPKKGCDIDFLHRVLSFYDVEKVVTGTTRQKLRKGDAEKLPIPLPPLPIQKQIAAILEKADVAREKRRQANQLTEQFLQSAFLEMFGDPVTNPRTWEVRTVPQIASNEKNAVKAGPFGSSLKKEVYVETGYKIYGQEQVIRDDPTFGDYFISHEKYEELEAYKIKEGDVLISLVGTYGKISIVPKGFTPGIINPRLMKISLNRLAMIPIVFKYILQSDSMKSIMAHMSHGGTMDIMNVGLMKELNIYVPPIDLQQKFVTLVEKVELLRTKQRDSEKELENLFQSLMQKAFRGELYI